MARSSFRAHGPTESRRGSASRLTVVLALAPAFAACVSYEPAPVDLTEVLAELEARRWPPDASAMAESADGAGPEQLSAFAVTHNPALRAARARIGVTRALLVEAGLLADPELGWDAMDVLASQIVDGTSSSVDVLAGFGLSFELPRPGELDARKGAARWRVEEARGRVTEAEWLLAREVFVTVEDVREARSLLAQNDELARVATTTREYFERAQSAGAATAIQANLAAGDLLSIRAERVRLEARLRDARQRLNALLGLPPAAEVALGAAGSPTEEPVEVGEDATALAERAVSLRPDLAAMLATYQAAEDDVRLEVARQFPLLAVGTGITLVPGFFSRFNRPAIATAIARREELRLEIEARVHEVRRDVHDAVAELQETRREVEFLVSELLPNAEESLRLAGEAFDAGEVTLLEILSLQRALVDARTRTTEARAELARRRWKLLAASGALLADDEPHEAAETGATDDHQPTPIR